MSSESKVPEKSCSNCAANPCENVNPDYDYCLLHEEIKEETKR
jgi:hypothetical protein